MAIVIIRQDGKSASWKKAIAAQAKGIPIYDFEEDHPREVVKMAIVWKHPEGSLSAYPNLGCIASFGAGVDFIFNDPGLPDEIPVTRVVDPVLATDMSEFVIARILGHLKNLQAYTLEHQQRIWNPKQYKRIRDVSVGIMGLGALGSALAKDLDALGFRTHAWVYSQGTREIKTFTGQEGLQAFLQETDILVCLLPLTPETQGILNKDLFRQLRPSAYIINVARGGHLVDEDLLEMIDSGHLSGAALDVFHEEPLPENHPFWGHPLIAFTPHVASVSDPDSVIPQLLENYRRLCQGEPLINLVSREKGY